jgi:hypothetical protein
MRATEVLMRVNFFLYLVLIVSTSANAMKRNEMSLPKTLSEQLLDFYHGNIEQIDNKIIKKWRREYMHFCDNNSTQASLEDFLEPYVAEIKRIFSHKKLRTSPNPIDTKITYDLVFFKYTESHELEAYYRQNLEVNFTNNQIITLGRFNFNTIYSPEFPKYISRVHLILIPVRDRVLIYDAFSLTGTEPIDINNLAYESVKENQNKGIKFSNPVFMPRSEAQYLRIGAGVLGILPREQARSDEERCCTICLDNFPDKELPCGHSCVCSECEKTLKNCPLCQKKIEGFLKFSKHNITFIK